MPSKIGWIIAFAGVVILAVGAIYAGLIKLPPIPSSDRSVMDAASDGKQARGDAKHDKQKGSSSGERKVLYYRNPMGLPDTSPIPKKDWMGMDYIAVYEDEDVGNGASVKISLDKIQRSGVRTEVVTARHLQRPIKAPGVAKVDERTMHAVTLRADGFIEKLYVEENGAQITAGQPLFRVYSQQMVTAQVDYKISLSDRRAGRKSNSLKGAKQKLDNLELPDYVAKEIRRTGKLVMTIEWPAPAGGVVMKKNVIEGQMVRMGDELFRIADLSKIWVIADVAEQDINLVAVGQKAKAQFRALPSKMFEGRVTFILHELDMATRTGKVRIEIDNPEHHIKHEMFADVEIDSGAGEAPRIAVPNSAVINSGDRQVVLVALGEGRFEPRDVTLGVRGKGYTEITDGIDAGEEVVVSANFLIDAESNLRAALSKFSAGSSTHQNAPKAGSKHSLEQVKP